MTAVVIEAKALTKDRVSQFLHRKTRVLENLNLTVNEGETYGLLGPNGAGKTTTLKILVGLLRPDAGEAIVLGRKAGNREALKKIGFLPENPYFYSHLTADEFLDFIGQLFGLKGQALKKKKEELLTLVSLADQAKIPMHKFSKGMLQRLGVAQSLVNDPVLIFWDEPMSGLDPIGRADVRRILNELKAQGKTIFFNSHLLPDVNEICDRVGIMHRGKLIAEDTVENISGHGDYKKLEDYFLAKIAEVGS